MDPSTKQGTLDNFIFTDEEGTIGNRDTLLYKYFENTIDRACELR